MFSSKLHRLFCRAHFNQPFLGLTYCKVQKRVSHSAVVWLHFSSLSHFCAVRWRKFLCQSAFYTACLSPPANRQKEHSASWKARSHLVYIRDRMYFSISGWWLPPLVLNRFFVRWLIAGSYVLTETWKRHKTSAHRMQEPAFCECPEQQCVMHSWLWWSRFRFMSEVNPVRRWAFSVSWEVIKHDYTHMDTEKHSSTWRKKTRAINILWFTVVITSRKSVYFDASMLNLTNLTTTSRYKAYRV